MPLDLVPLCHVQLELGRPVRVGAGPSGERTVVDVTSMVLTGERLSGRSTGAAADWLTVSGGVATVDVRATIVTDDGARIFVQYSGRSDASAGVGAAAFYVTPRFETGDERYAWLNAVQAVGKGSLAERAYDWYALR